MNDALDHGEHMRSETVTMSRDEYEAAIRAAKVEAWQEGHDAGWNEREDFAMCGSWPRDVCDSTVENPYRADELEGEG